MVEPRPPRLQARQTGVDPRGDPSQTIVHDAMALPKPVTIRASGRSHPMFSPATRTIRHRLLQFGVERLELRPRRPVPSLEQSPNLRPSADLELGKPHRVTTVEHCAASDEGLQVQRPAIPRPIRAKKPYPHRQEPPRAWSLSFEANDRHRRWPLEDAGHCYDKPTSNDKGFDPCTRRRGPSWRHFAKRSLA